MHNRFKIINDEHAKHSEEELYTIWGLMIHSMDTVLVTRRSQECLELYRWIFEAHQHAVGLCHYHWVQPELDVTKLAKARYLASAFSSLLEAQYPVLTIKYRPMLSNIEMLEVLNAKMAVQYANTALGPDTSEYSTHMTA